MFCEKRDKKSCRGGGNRAGKLAFTLPKDVTHVARWKSLRKVGFTLAEALITLGIIGIVAALTLPVLIQNYKKQEVSVKLKKFYSTMMQAYNYAEFEQGVSSDNWEFNDFSMSNIERAEVYYNTFFNNKYFNVLSVKRGTYPSDSRKALEVTFADGSILYLWAGSAMDIIYDVNGKKGPNKAGSDFFKFMHFPKRRLQPYVIEGGSVDSINTREKALGICKRFSTECVPLLMYDNWEFKKDYPYKL